MKKYTYLLVFYFVIQQFHLSAQKPVIHSPVIERIDGDFQFLEGPVWYKGYVLFSDIPANRIYSWKKEEGLKVFLEPSGNSNGLRMDKDGFLLMAQHGNRQIGVLDLIGEEFGLVWEFNGKRFNSPNDLTIRSDGSIYFTDPPYGISPEQAELDFSGVYLWTMEDDLYLLDSTMSRPNGIALSPDETTLYVTESPSRTIYAWDVEGNTVVNRRVFAVMDREGGNADGMKVDPNGFLYVTGPGGVWIFTPEGKKHSLIEIPGQVTNCSFGGEKGNELYVTTAKALYRVWNGK
jgi:gluconolactonase